MDLLLTRLPTTGYRTRWPPCVLAAYTGVNELRDALTGGNPDLPPVPEAGSCWPDLVYLSTIRVAGFQSIGQQANLQVPIPPRPHPGRRAEQVATRR